MNNHRVLFCLASFAIITVAGCKANEDYDLQKEIDTEITVFQDGITIPLGSTKPIYLKDLIPTDEEGSVIKSTDEGYTIDVNGEMDLSENIPDIKSQLPKIDNIPPVTLESKYHIGTIDVASFSVDEQTILDMSYATSSDFNISALESIDVDESKTWKAGITEYSSVMSGKSISIPQISTTVGTFLDGSAANWVDLLTSDAEIKVPDNLVLDTHISDSWQVNCNMEFDDVIKEIKSVKLTSDSKLKIEVKLVNPVLTAGTICADAALDLSPILKISGVDGAINVGDISLSESNGYSASKEYTVESIVIKEGDWNSSTHSLNISRSVSMNGEFLFSGLKTSKSVFKAARAKGDMYFTVNVSFNGFKIADAQIALNEIETDQQEDIAVPIPDIELPKAVTAVDWVSFNDTKDLVLTATAGNIPSGLKFVIDKLTLEFPSCVGVDGASGNVLEYTNLAISDVPGQSISKKIHLDKITFPEAVQGKISITEKIKVHAVAHACTAEGQYISFSSIPKDAKDDMFLTFALKGILAIDDFLIHVDNSQSFNYSEPFEIQLPDACKDFGNFTVTPKGTPKLRISISAPNAFAENSGVKFTLPSFMELSDNSPGSYHTFDKNNNILTFDKGAFPESVVLSVDKLNMVPVDDGGKYLIKGVVGFTCPEIIPQSGEVTKELFDKFTTKDISIKVGIDKVEPDNVQMTKFNIPVEEKKVKIDIIKDGDIPSELLAIGEIVLEEPVSLDFALQTSGLPTLAGGKYFHVALDLTFPEFLVVEGVDKKNHLRLEGDIVDGKLALNVKILTLNFRGVDLSKGLSGEISVSGSVSADNPQVDLKSLAEDIKVNFAGTVSEIKLKSVQAYVDYKIDSIHEAFNLGSQLPEILKSGEIVLDIVNPSLALEITSNMGIPVNGDLLIEAYKDNKVVNSVSLSLDDVIPYTSDPSKTKTAGIYIAGDGAGCPEGYTWERADIASIVRTLPDSLVVSAELGTDKEKPCFLDLTADYSLGMKYEFKVPFEFGGDFYLSVKDTLNTEGLGDILNSTVVQLEIEASNSIPLNLSVALDFIDKDGEIVPSASPLHGIIKAGDKDGGAVTSKFEISTALAPGADPSTITGLLYNVALMGVPDYSRTVTENDYATLRLSATLPEGYTVDVSQFVETDEDNEK